MKKCQPIDHRCQRGSALIVVLWTSILIAMILVGALAAVRIEARSARARADSLQARSAVQSGLDLAAWRLATGEFQSVTELANAPPIEINNYVVSVVASKESQKIDINLAEEQTLSGLFVLLGEDLDKAQQLAARIADWRDRDDLARPNGAERRDYINAGDGEAIGNRYFQSVDELERVLNFPPTLFNCARYALTTMGDKGVGSSSLLKELYGRALDQPKGNRQIQLGTSSRSARAGSRYSITVTATGPNNHLTSLTGLFRVTGGRERPFEYIAVYAALDEKRAESLLKCHRAETP